MLLACDILLYNSRNEPVLNKLLAKTISVSEHNLIKQFISSGDKLSSRILVIIMVMCITKHLVLSVFELYIDET